jgi:hypothetical protein
MLLALCFFWFVLCVFASLIQVFVSFYLLYDEHVRFMLCEFQVERLAFVFTYSSALSFLKEINSELQL